MGFLEMFNLSFMRNALLVLLCSSSILSCLGVYVVLKRIVFTGIAISQAASLGYALGSLLGLDPKVCSLIAGLLSGLLFWLHFEEKRFTRESLIGLGYALASSLGIIFISKSAAGEADTLNLLFGNILLISPRDVYLVAAVSLSAMLFLLLLNKEISFVLFDAQTARAQGLNARAFELLFYICLAMVISIVISVIGVLLAFSLLLIPALSGLSRGYRLAGVFRWAAGAGIISSITGLIVSYYFDLPAGPAVVALNCAFFGLLVLLRRQNQPYC